MNSRKILYVCQEIMPYLPQTDMSQLCRTLSQAMQEKGNEIRTFTPRYGCINERRNQLHEVIRLSGMNLIINDNDHQLIIKVASIPSARVQIYFIDNDDCFGRKAVLEDEQGNCFPDNDDRAIFFARGVIETVRKLRWQPDIVHCHGWFTSMVPSYIRYMFADDPLFMNTKIVMSLYNDRFCGELDGGFAEKLAGEGVDRKILDVLGQPSYENLMKFVINLADGVILETEQGQDAILEYLKDTGKPVLQYQHKNTTEYLDNYQEFYEKIL